MTNEVGRVLGTEDAHPLEFWVGVAEDSYLQLDDIVAVDTEVPGRGEITLYGVVDIVRAKYEGAKFDSDVFHIAEGTFPAGIATAAHVSVTRIEPEVFVPPQPGQQARRAVDAERETALYFDQMKNRFAAGLSREGDVIWGNLEFLDGTRGAHVNVSGISGVATKTSCAMFLLYSLFHSDALGANRHNARAVIFNVKGEDLMFADKPNAWTKMDDETSTNRKRQYAQLGLPCGPFKDVGLWAPVSSREELVHALGSRQEGVVPYAWSLREFCQQRLLRFLFAESDNETSRLSYAIRVAETYLARFTAGQTSSWVQIGDRKITDFDALIEFVTQEREQIFTDSLVVPATQQAFLSRFRDAGFVMGNLIRRFQGDEREADHRIDWRKKELSVIDINSLHDRAKRFVVGVVLKQLLEEKERSGKRQPLVFLVLDELNKYAPRDGWSPIKEILLDVAERGRSLGVVLIGAQQTASEVERRVVANSSFRIVGRLDTAESQRGEYGFLTDSARARASLLKPGSMFLHQPELPVPLLMQFPMPSWATRSEEAASEPAKWR